MKRMITAALTVAALAVAPGTEAAEISARQLTKIVKRVVRAELREVAPVEATHTATADHATTANHADYAPNAEHAHRADQAATADQATRAGHATTADRAGTVDHAATSDSATTAETAEVAGVAESANPMAYALIKADGTVDASRSLGISQADVTRSGALIYCFFGPQPKGIQVTVLDSPANVVPSALSVGLGGHQNCPNGTAFYVMGKDPNTGNIEPASFFLSLVL